MHIFAQIFFELLYPNYTVQPHLSVQAHIPSTLHHTLITLGYLSTALSDIPYGIATLGDILKTVRQL